MNMMATSRTDKFGGVYHIYTGPESVTVSWVRGARPIGTCTADFTDIYGPGRWWLCRLVITDREMRRKKIGSKMLTQLKGGLVQNPTFNDLLVAPGGYDMSAEEQFAFYRSQGFVQIDDSGFVWAPVREIDCVCGAKAYKVSGRVIYPKRPDLFHLKFFLCSKCCRYTGTHPDGSPKGRPADKETREARIAAHKVFDDLWRPVGEGEPMFRRDEAYEWLSTAMGIPDAHIGNMDAPEAMRAKELVENLLKEKK